MAKRFTCWVIVTGSQRRRFRARNPEDLIPTLKQLQRTQPDSVMKWFERGKLWNSPEDAMADLRAERDQKPPSRGEGWRPGGEHKDPRAQYQLTRDQKRARFKQRQRWDGPGGFRPRQDEPGGGKFGDRPPDKPAAGSSPARPWPAGHGPDWSSTAGRSTAGRAAAGRTATGSSAARRQATGQSAARLGVRRSTPARCAAVWAAAFESSAIRSSTVRSSAFESIGRAALRKSLGFRKPRAGTVAWRQQRPPNRKQLGEGSASEPGLRTAVGIATASATVIRRP
jgi:hypothetical protein